MTQLKAYRLRWVLGAVLSGLLLTLWLGLSGWFYLRSLDDTAAEVRKGLRYELGRLALQMQHELQEGRPGEAERLLTFLGAEPGIEAVALLDETGRVWMANHFAWKGKPLTAWLPDANRQALERTRRQRRPEVIFDWRTLWIEAFYPVIWQSRDTERLREERVAVLYVRRDLRPMQVVILREVGLSSLLLAGALLIAWAGLWWILKRLLLEPLDRIGDTMRRFAQGDRQAHLEVEGRGELAHVAVAFNDVAAKLRRSEAELLQAQALYDTLSEINQQIVRSQSPEQLLERVCRVLVERAGFALVWVGETDPWGRVRAVYMQAEDPALLTYLAELEIGLDPRRASGRGPTATAIREGRVVIVNDFQASAMTTKWRQRARRHGIAASAAIPVGRPQGPPLVLNVYARQAGFFTLQIRRLLEELGEDLTFALGHFENQARRRAAEAALRANEKRLQVTFDSIGDAVIVTDAAGRVERMNAVAEQLTGWPPAEAEGKPMTEVFHIVSARTGEPVPNPVAEVLREGKVIGLANDTTLISRDGRRYQIADSAAPIRDESGAVSGVVLVFHDVSEQYAMRRALEESEARYRRIFEEGMLPELLLDPQTGAIVDANATACRFYGFARETLCQMSLAQLNSRGEEESQRMLREPQGCFQLSQRLVSGEIREVEWYCAPMEIGGRRLLHAIVVDVTERQRMEEEIRQLAFYDPLTGLPNRRLFLDHLSRELAAARRHRDWGGLLFLDLDNFKHLNDAWGHQLGDALLVQVAGRLQRHLRSEDSVARLGGDEFVVLLPRLGEDEPSAADHLRTVAEKIRLHVAAEFDLGSRSYHTSVSIGVTLFHGGESVEELLKQADAAMYRAKAAGRNAIRFYHPAMQRSVDARLELEKELRRALERGGLELHYQPQHCAAGRLAGAEALLRWPHPQHGFVPPNEFIPIAEESGLILPLGRWVLETACRQISRWYREGLLAGIDHIAVNISPRQFHQPEFVAEVEAVLAATGAPPQKLMLELTEGIVIEDVTDTIAKMEALREVGVRFSIDDFGTGYSSLLYLKRLPLDEIKIDRSFVSDLETDPNDRAIVETILSMARHLDLAVVAEGVETETQRDFLKRHGCRFYQGWFYSKPLPAAEFRERLRRRRLSA
ncbi:hypothetical protein MIN45_P1278 [Methylomarinovum tepidoasis]|uniref:cyclic-guanylate-specific phosphodiesterase n=1 Tax=Methylomarinovum tepidoasis TaxID=2840183 RepID=A0AAU9CR99_9GAMM|nr:EAL domain-containing protein [Methylomarinovum sp. IN45]BCX88908.1 hypothetical protein MIN45_P1278 [Methylomarinovum sp. IN45]